MNITQLANSHPNISTIVFIGVAAAILYVYFMYIFPKLVRNIGETREEKFMREYREANNK